MRTLRLLAVALALLAAASLAVGAAGFSDVSAERGVQISVVDDGSAYVGVTACYKANEAGNANSNPGSATPVRVWVTNRHSDAFVVESIERADAPIDGETTNGGGTVDVGTTDRYEIAFDGSVSAVTVTVSGDGLDAVVTRRVVSQFDCPSAPDGNSQAAQQGTGTPTPESTTAAETGSSETATGSTD